MTDDRTEMKIARDAGLVKRHEQRLARATGHAPTCPVPCCGPTGDPVTDMVIPPEAVPFVAQNVVNQLGDLWDVPVDKRQATNDDADQFVTRLFNASTKPLVETATRLGRELGRREAAEEIAAALETEALSDYDAADDLRWAAAKAREITATKEPAYKPEASRTRCSHCGFYRPSLLNHHPECPHAATKEPK